LPCHSTAVKYIGAARLLVGPFTFFLIPFSLAFDEHAIKAFELNATKFENNSPLSEKEMVFIKACR
jgi:hypothetical protein